MENKRKLISQFNSEFLYIFLIMIGIRMILSNYWIDTNYDSYYRAYYSLLITQNNWIYEGTTWLPLPFYLIAVTGWIVGWSSTEVTVWHYYLSAKIISIIFNSIVATVSYWIALKITQNNRTVAILNLILLNLSLWFLIDGINAQVPESTFLLIYIITIACFISFWIKLVDKEEYDFNLLLIAILVSAIGTLVIFAGWIFCATTTVLSFIIMLKFKYFQMKIDVLKFISVLFFSALFPISWFLHNFIQSGDILYFLAKYSLGGEFAGYNNPSIEYFVMFVFIFWNYNYVASNIIFTFAIIGFFYFIGRKDGFNIGSVILILTTSILGFHFFYYFPHGLLLTRYFLPLVPITIFFAAYFLYSIRIASDQWDLSWLEKILGSFRIIINSKELKKYLWMFIITILIIWGSVLPLKYNITEQYQNYNRWTLQIKASEFISKNEGEGVIYISTPTIMVFSRLSSSQFVLLDDITVDLHKNYDNNLSKMINNLNIKYFVDGDMYAANLDLHHQIIELITDGESFQAQIMFKKTYLNSYVTIYKIQ